MDTLPSQFASLRNEEAFPVFKNLPHDLDLDDDYYDTTGRPIIHWCFLGQVVQIDDITRLRLVVKDKTGQVVVVAFYTGRDHHPHHPQLRVGSTIAILYAQQHIFLDSSVGIRLETAENLKVIPMGLDELLELSDKMQDYAIEDNGVKKCQGCDRRAASLRNCAKCVHFSYCDKDCQTVAWNDKGHKADCKVLRDADFGGLLRLQWNVFGDYRRFPLNPQE
ncbi:MYND finger domain-containing protein [Hirsutella rhossiliensis]|uniref:MYND finger domain-containing protein n=1 Tax=Hirsutella rhossiliensis TaxID=111463 RepID=A0A9P8SKN3_9HYPO|nr:MYND finger domain-containing protein [Hirsutella rhossiliensis]KAH0966061.1 MYND finger domain-containing protein [Hirsutella rhossiliensis]